MTRSLAPSEAELQTILYQALAEPIGLLLATSDWARARQKLYLARTKLGDPSLAHLQIRHWPGEEGDLVIVKGERKNVSKE